MARPLKIKIWGKGKRGQLLSPFPFNRRVPSLEQVWIQTTSAYEQKLNEKNLLIILPPAVISTISFSKEKRKKKRSPWAALQFYIIIADNIQNKESKISLNRNKLANSYLHIYKITLDITDDKGFDTCRLRELCSF